MENIEEKTLTGRHTSPPSAGPQTPLEPSVLYQPPSCYQTHHTPPPRLYTPHVQHALLVQNARPGNKHRARQHAQRVRKQRPRNRQRLDGEAHAHPADGRLLAAGGVHVEKQRVFEARAHGKHVLTQPLVDVLNDHLLVADNAHAHAAADLGPKVHVQQLFQALAVRLAPLPKPQHCQGARGANAIYTLRGNELKKPARHSKYYSRVRSAPIHTGVEYRQ